LAHAFALADYAEALCVLAVTDAALGNKDDAILKLAALSN